MLCARLSWLILSHQQHLDLSRRQTSGHICEKVSRVETLIPGYRCDVTSLLKLLPPYPPHQKFYILLNQVNRNPSSRSCFWEEFCPGNTSSNWCPRHPRKYVIPICHTHLYCNVPSDVTGNFKSDLGRWSKYLLVLVHAWTGPLAIYIQNLGSRSHFSVLPLSLQHEQELQPAPALPSPALHSAAAAWCTDLLFNCAMWSLKDFFSPSLLLNSQDEIGFWSATLFSSSLPWGRVAKKDFCFVPFCLQSSG